MKLRALGCLALAWIAGSAQVVLADAGPVEDGRRESFRQAIAGMGEIEREQFFRGRALFLHSWIVAPSQDSQFVGLGPLYNRIACVSCHPKNGRGHAPSGPDERMQSMLVRLSVPGAGVHGEPRPHPVYGDQLNEEGIPGVAGEGRASVRWQESTTMLADGQVVQLRRPELAFVDLAYGRLGDVLVSPRVAPAVFGLGLLETVPASALESSARESKPDGVRGRVNRVWDVSEGRSVVGRFGLKANAPSLRQQIAGAFIGDLGITSDLFPNENCMPAQTACIRAPSGGHPELSRAELDDLEFYIAHLDAPPRRAARDPSVQRGERLFLASGCALCHRPTLPTGAHAKFPALSSRSISPYTDLLLHDMGEGLADHRPDYLAGGRDWRTPPLWGIGLVATVNEVTNFLHDGRARNLEEAILWHAGEAQAARDRYAGLSRAQRQDLVRFLESL